MTLEQLYHNLVDNQKIDFDANQIKIINELDAFKFIIEKANINKSNYLSKIYNKIITSLFAKYVHKYKYQDISSNYLGVYIYSDVGRGKTMLMDLFYDNINLSDSQKYRTHFHLFMREIHHQLKNLKINNPIDYIVENNFKNYKLICLDEFIVNDIADAVLLARIIRALIKNKIYFITTSNIHPNDLYKNGLQRNLFLPAISLINNNYNILNLSGNIDYRAKMLAENSCYFFPESKEALNKLENLFIKLASDFNFKKNNFITILDRKIKYICNSENIVWFDFDVLCNTSRSQNDYLEIAYIYNTVFISGLYILDDSKSHVVRRFINLIDVLYDAKVNLIISACADYNNIYIGTNLKFEFARTISRIKEMQSVNYLNKSHLS